MPREFSWGVATAAYQIEGAADREGRTPSIWDVFAHTSGKTHNGDTGDVACAHYDLWESDLDRLQWLGVTAYRFSVSWSRVLPDGTGAVNPAGIEFYSRLIDGLLERGITPWLTIYHWDLPQVLHERGGWLNRECSDWFAEYTQVLIDHFGDRITNWITINEPHCVAWFGYYRGWFAPGITDLQSSIDVSHHLLLAHGKAARLIKSQLPEARVGIAPGLTPVEPATDSDADRAAAARMDGYDIRWFLDPVYGRGYPQDVIQQLGVVVPILDGDLEIIASPTDFLGVNYYLRSVVKDAPADGFLDVDGVDDPDAEMTAMGWEIYPQGLTDLLVRLTQEYAVPSIFITENGSAWNDEVTTAGAVHDAARISYLARHLAAVEAAVQAGAPVDGYFAWSFMDNFEWNSGYAKRFGLFYVDYPTQERIPKDSAYWYRAHIAGAVKPS